MSVLLAVISFGATGWSQSQGKNLRSIDFKNFSYPWIHPHGWPNHLQWMSLSLKQHIQLLNGKWDGRDAGDSGEDSPFSGLTLEDIGYGKLSGNRDDAIVVLRYDSGGTQYHYWVYIYEPAGKTPRLIGFFHAGDRAYYGLYRVFVKVGILNVELFDPKDSEGDCCSTGYIRYQFRWNGQGFESVGSPSKGKVDSVSRRAVSIFGLPIEGSNSGNQH